MDYDRNALIAHLYDIYSVEQAIVKSQENLEEFENKDFETVELKTAEKIKKEIENLYSKNSTKKDKQREILINQKREFEQELMKLYDDLLLIPYPHRNIYSICYIYRYLTSSRIIDLKYIFTQLYLDKILNEVKKMVKCQQDIIIIQRLILAENAKQTIQLEKIDGDIWSFNTNVSNAMENLRRELVDINSDQHSLLNNQATMYNAYLQNAYKAEKNQEVANDYLKMIDNNVRINAIFKEAEFFNYKIDRNFSGNITII